MAQKPKPERDKNTIILKESQRISLTAIENQHQQVNAELKQLQSNSEKIKEEIQKRVNIISENRTLQKLILQEVEGEQGLETGCLITAYVFDGKDFVMPKAGN